MMARRHSRPLIAALAAGSAGGVLAVLSSAGMVGQRAVFSSLTLLLLIYLGIEIARVRRVQPERWLLNPAVVASFLTFCVSFGLGNVLFFLPAETIRVVGLVPDVTPAMVKLMWLVLLGAIAMWTGYWLPAASRPGSTAMQRAVSRWFSVSNKPRKLALPVLVGISFAVRLLQIKLGVFGYSSNNARLIEMGSVTQYLTMGASLGTVALVVASLGNFSGQPNPGMRVWFICVLLLEVAFGLLSGFKSQVAMPFVIVGACKYLQSGKLPKVWLVWFFAALMVGYAVIEPFRAEKNYSDFYGTSTAGIIDLFIVSLSNNVAVDNSTPMWVALSARSSSSYVASLGVAYRDENHELPQGSPDFLVNIALAPAYAYIPRLLMDKPLGDLGLWYTHVVVGYYDSESSTAMSPMTYLYFAGGPVAIFIGFLCFGLVQKALVLLIRPTLGSARALVYLSILPTVTSIDSAVDGVVVIMCRMIPLLFLLQYFIYQRGQDKVFPAAGTMNKGVR
jgi:hypothetical protein